MKVNQGKGSQTSLLSCKSPLECLGIGVLMARGSKKGTKQVLAQTFPYCDNLCAWMAAVEKARMVTTKRKPTARMTTTTRRPTERMMTIGWSAGSARGFRRESQKDVRPKKVRQFCVDQQKITKLCGM